MNFLSTVRHRRVEPPPLQQAPTHTRWRVAAFLAVISGLTYLDRLNFAIAGKSIQDEFRFSIQQMGWLLSAFVLGYALFQIPGGWLADRMGGRRMMSLAVAWWSVFTAATAIAPRLPLAGWFGVAWAFAIVRFLVGVGEASSAPTSSQIVGAWMGRERRGAGSSLSLIGIGLGGALAPLLITWILRYFGWRPAFFLCGFVGMIVALCWFLDVTDRPEEHPGVNAAELAHIDPGKTRGSVASGAPRPRPRPSYRQMLASRSVWGLSLGYFCQGYPIYIFHTWFFIYLVRVRGLSLFRGGLWDSAPYLTIVALAPLGGWFSDRAARRLGPKLGRRSAAWLGMGASALLLWTGAHAASQPVALALLSLAAGCNMFAAATWWAVTIDLAPDYAASLSGVMNTFGNLGGWLSPIATAYIASSLGWTAALDTAALVTVVGALLWFLVDPSRPLGAESGQAPAHAATA